MDIMKRFEESEMTSLADFISADLLAQGGLLVYRVHYPDRVLAGRHSQEYRP